MAKVSERSYEPPIKLDFFRIVSISVSRAFRGMHPAGRKGPNSSDFDNADRSDLLTGSRGRLERLPLAKVGLLGNFTEQIPRFNIGPLEHRGQTSQVALQRDRLAN